MVISPYKLNMQILRKGSKKSSILRKRAFMKLGKLLLPEKKSSYVIFYGIVIVITLFMMVGLAYVETDSDVVKLLPDNASTRAEKEKIRRYKTDFPSSDNSVFLAIEFGTMTPEKFAKLWELNQKLENLEVDGVKYVSSVMSPFNTVYFKKTGNTFIPKTFFTKPFVSSSFEKTLEEASQFEIITGAVLSYDKKSVAMLVNMNDEAIIKGVKKKNFYHLIGEKLFGKNYGDIPLTRNIFCNTIDDLLSEYEDDFHIYSAGVGIYEAKSEKYMVRDIVVLIIPAVFMIVLMLYLNFRSKRGTVLPILGILLSLLWTLGAMGWFRFKLNVVAIVIPPLILTVGSSYTLHYLNSYYLHSREKDRRKLVYLASKAIFPTIIMAAVTTIIGFASFFTASMTAIRFFGMWIVISILFTLFFTFFLLSKLLYKLVPPEDSHLEKVENDWIAKFLNKLYSLVIPPYNKIWMGILGFCFILFFLTVFHIKVETNTANFFKKNDPVKKSMVYLQKNYLGTISLNVTIKAQQKDYFRTQEGLEIGKKVQDVIENNLYIKGKRVTGWVMSPIKMLEEINVMMTGEKELPQDENIINRFYNLLSISIRSNPMINSFINNDLSGINFQVRSYSDNPRNGYVVTEKEISELNQLYIDEFQKIEEEYKGSVTIETWGESVQLSKISKYLLDDQIGSILFTLIFIFITVLIMFKSAYFASLSLIPLIFGIIMNFTIMSLFGIALDVATIMIASISMGVGIDNSLHFLLNYERFLNQGLVCKEALKRTFLTATRPIFFTSLSLIAGFLIFMLSTFKPVYYFGVLIAISMFNCTFAALLILPSFLIVTDKWRLWSMNKKKTVESK